MKQPHRAHLALESLETRLVPAVLFRAGVLTILRNAPAPATVNITQSATVSNRFTLSGSFTGTFSGVSLINYRGNNSTDTINLNLNGNTYGGSAIFQTLFGPDSINVFDGVVAGRLTLLTGGGADTIRLGNSAGGLTVQGSITAADLQGVNTAILGGAGALEVEEDLTLTGYNNATHTGTGALRVARNLTINNGITAGANNVILGGGAAVQVFGNLFVTTGRSSDTVTLGNATDALEAAGQVTVFTGNGNDTVNVYGAGPAGGGFLQLNLLTGLGNDTVNLTATADAYWLVAIQLAEGNDTFNLLDGAVVGETYISGSVSGGPGVNTRGPQGASWINEPPYTETGF